jgi:hypothetical protein
MLGGAPDDPLRFGVVTGERRDRGREHGQPAAVGRMLVDLADQDLKVEPGDLGHRPVDQLGAADLFFPAQRGADGLAADPVGAALVAEQEAVAAGVGEAFPVPAERDRSGARDDHDAGSTEKRAVARGVGVASDVHRAARLPSQGLTELTGLARGVHAGQADTRCGRVDGGDDVLQLLGEPCGEQRVHRRAVRLGRYLACFEDDGPGPAASGVDAEEPPG